jgi:hypothetical protein
MSMPERLVLSDFSTGFETRFPAFKISNESLPHLVNAYAWRGRVLRKRGSKLLGRLQREFDTITLTQQTQAGDTTTLTDILADTSINVRTAQPNADIKPESLTFAVGADTWSDATTPGILTATGGNAIDGIINYSTGVAVLNWSLGTGPGAGMAIVVTLDYYPTLPSLGLNNYEEEVASDDINFPTAVYFDQTYAYQYSLVNTEFFDVSFYKNSVTVKPVTWTGAIYEQFWGINYKNALWVTNGTAGFHYEDIVSIGDQSSTTITVRLTTNDLELGDVCFFNEVQGTTTGINLQTGTVTTKPAGAPFDYVFTFSTTVTVNTITPATGICQYLTSTLSGAGDGIRWYDGFNASHSKGFVNFSPPLESGDAPPYLMGAKMIRVFKNRLLFFGTYEGRPGGTVIFYPDRVRASQNEFNGPPYYASLIPANQSFDAESYMDNIGGKGFFTEAGTTENIISTTFSYDIIIVGFSSSWRQLIYTQNEEDPFIFHTIDVEFGNESRFATITLKDGLVAPGDRGYVSATPSEVERIDLKIPNQIYQIENASNGNKKVTAIRDHENEWIFFSYPTSVTYLDSSVNRFNNRTLLFNYTEGNYAILEESYTAYGIYRESQPFTWENNPWGGWDQAGQATWESGFNLARFPEIACGNQQGFISIRTNGTQESKSLTIRSITTATKIFEVPDHGLQANWYVRVEDCLGVTEANNLIGRIASTPTKDTIELEFVPDITLTGTYGGAGVLRRIPNFEVYTKQFPNFWANGRKMRVSNIRTLTDTTSDGKYILQIFSSQSQGVDSTNYSYIPTTQIVYTKPEKAFLQVQSQIWHRNIVSMTGDSIQLGFTMNDEQIRNFEIASSEWSLHSVVMDIFQAGYIGGPYLG